jgi:hypothetical protein
MVKVRAEYRQAGMAERFAENAHFMCLLHVPSWALLDQLQIS